MRTCACCEKVLKSRQKKYCSRKCTANGRQAQGKNGCHKWLNVLLNKDDMYVQYVQERKTIATIAREYGVTWLAVKQRINDYGLTR